MWWNTRITLKLWLLAVVLATFNCVASGEGCKPENGSVIDVPVELSFASAAFNDGGFYRTLDPRFVFLDNDAISEQPYLSSVQEGKLHLSFCISADLGGVSTSGNEKVTHPNATWTFVYAARRITVRLRPIKWKAGKTALGSPSYLGSTTSVVVDAQPDPDWLAIVSAKWQKDNQGTIFLDVVTQNRGPANPGVDIMIAHTRKVSCIAGPSMAFSVTANITYQSGILKVATTDPDYADPVERASIFRTARCGDNTLQIALGNTGAVESGEIKRIRYRFNKDMIPELRKKFSNAPISPLALFPQASLTFVGQNIFPREIHIDGGAEVFPRQ